MPKKKNYVKIMPKTGKSTLVSKGYLFGNQARVNIVKNADKEFEGDIFRANIRVVFDYKPQIKATSSAPVLNVYGATEQDFDVLIQSLQSAIISLENGKRRLKRAKQTKRI